MSLLSAEAVCTETPESTRASPMIHSQIHQHICGPYRDCRSVDIFDLTHCLHFRLSSRYNHKIPPGGGKRAPQTQIRNFFRIVFRFNTFSNGISFPTCVFADVVRSVNPSRDDGHLSVEPYRCDPLHALLRTLHSPTVGAASK